jgi:hypothetical protein
MTDNLDDDDYFNTNVQSLATDRWVGLFRYLGFIGAIGLFGLAIWAANR